MSDEFEKAKRDKQEKISWHIFAPNLAGT